ncbi:hypothetical protein AMTRI_Chr04g243590 [Amborella trichopoda]
MALTRSILRRDLATPLIMNVLGSYFNSEAFALHDTWNELSSPGFSRTQKFSTIHFTPSSTPSSKTCLSTLFPTHSHSTGLNIELVDLDPWWVSSDDAQDSIETHEEANKGNTHEDESNSSLVVDKEFDFDEIEDMRLHGNLYYRLDRDSREFEEYNFDFHRRRKTKMPEETRAINKQPEAKSKPLKTLSSLEVGELTMNKNRASRQKAGNGSFSANDATTCLVGDKKLRSPTYNQLTDPYMQPFCLDVYISKSSVRACIIHRVTSKVVAVAHSISKDMKHDLVSTKDSIACEAVGVVLAQRAIADDIHNVFYTPRKGEKIEGKLQIVLQSLIDHGINVKVKIKQRKTTRVHCPDYVK